MLFIRISIRKATCARVRFWVEPDDLSAIAESEVLLRPTGAGGWTGRIPAEILGCARSFLYRLAITVCSPALWSLRIEDEATGRLLVADADKVDGHKAWLVGTCRPGLTMTPDVDRRQKGSRSGTPARATARTVRREPTA